MPKDRNFIEWTEIMPFPVPSHPIASFAFVSLPEVKHPETGVKVNYAMVIVCRLTGYILAIPCRQEGLTSHKAAALLLHYCAFFTGMPSEIHSDNRSIISSDFFDTLCGLAGITQARSIVYRPQSCGRAEQAVQSIINGLRLYLVFRKLDWIYALPFDLWGLNDLRGPVAPNSPHRHKGGDAVGKRPQPRLLSDALTGEWRNGEAGEGRGSEPCEPGGLRHRA